MKEIIGISDTKTDLDITSFDKIKVRPAFKGNSLSSICSPVIRNVNLFFALIITLVWIFFYPVKPAFPGNT